MKKILFIVGSLRKHSFNRQLAEKAQELLEDKAAVEFLDFSRVPLFNQDLEKSEAETLGKVKNQIRENDGIVIFSPEYNGSVTGVLKNLLDWVSRSEIPGDFKSNVMYGRKVLVTGVGGKNACRGSIAEVERNLRYIGSVVPVKGEGFVLPNSAWMTDIYSLSTEDAKKLNSELSAFLASL